MYVITCSSSTMSVQQSVHLKCSGVLISSFLEQDVEHPKSRERSREFQDLKCSLGTRLRTHPGPHVLSCSLQGVWTLKGQFDINLGTLETDSSQSALLVRGAKRLHLRAAGRISVISYPLFPVQATPRSRPIRGLLERLRADHVLEKKTAELGSAGIVMNRVNNEGTRF